MHEHVNIHILLVFCGIVYTAVCEKCLVCIEESVLLQVVCIGIGVVRLGGVWRGGGGGDGPCFRK